MAVERAVPVTKPATERIAGRLRRKVSPRLVHAVVQRRIAAALGAWADASRLGEVGTEWDFRLRVPDGRNDALVPDVAYLSSVRAGAEIAQVPRVAPDVAVEIRSPGESAALREKKIARYLGAGTVRVWDVDPARKTIVVHARDAKPRRCGVGRPFTDDALAGFELDLTSVFAFPAATRASRE